MAVEQVPIECNSENGTKYNLIQAAYVDKPGSDLAAELGILPQDDVLFAVFAQNDATGNDVSSKPRASSALCVYSLKSIRRKFMSNIQRCFRGEGMRGLGFISPLSKCVHTVSQISAIYIYILFFFSFCYLSSSFFLFFFLMCIIIYFILIFFFF